MPSRSPLTILVLSAALLSCFTLTARAQEETAPDSSATPSPTETVLASGWRVYEMAADGYVVSLPPTWRRIDLDPATVAAGVDASGVLDEDTAAWLGKQAVALIASQVSFFGFDFSPSGLRAGFATNANIIHTQLPPAIPLATMVQISVAQLENLPVVQGAVTHQAVTGAAGKGEQLNYHLQSGDHTLAVS